MHICAHTRRHLIFEMATMVIIIVFVAVSVLVVVVAMVAAAVVTVAAVAGGGAGIVGGRPAGVAVFVVVDHWYEYSSWKRMVCEQRFHL